MKFTEQEARQSFLELLRIPSVTATAGEEQACAYLESILDRFGIAHHPPFSYFAGSELT